MNEVQKTLFLIITAWSYFCIQNIMRKTDTFKFNTFIVKEKKLRYEIEITVQFNARNCIHLSSASFWKLGSRREQLTRIVSSI